MVILKPAGYDPERAEPFPFLIFPHGGGGQNQDTFWQLMFFVWNELIGDGETGQTRPLFVIFPGVVPEENPDPATTLFGNRHLWTDSERNGKFGALIVEDPVNWVESTFANVGGNRQLRSVAGFSMGGGGAQRLAIKHHDIFGSSGAWASEASIFAAGTGLFPIVIQEAQNRGQTGPDYDFLPTNGGITLRVFAGAGAFSPNINPDPENPFAIPEYKLDFPFLVELDNNNQEVINDEVFRDRWVTNHDPATLLESRGIQNGEVSMYFEVGDQDGFKPFNDALNEELTDLGYDHVYNVFEGGHELPEAQSYSGNRDTKPELSESVQSEHDDYVCGTGGG